MRDSIRNGMAQALHLTSWIDREESRGRTYPGERAEDVAPSEVPAVVFKATDKLIEEFERVNGLDAETLFRHAILVDEAQKAMTTGSAPDRSAAEKLFDDEELARKFGYCVAMESLGTGVSWNDDHADPDMSVPHCSFGEADLDEAYLDEAMEMAFERVREGRTLRLTSSNGSFPFTGESDEDRLVLTGMGFPEGIVDDRGQDAFLEVARQFALEHNFDSDLGGPSPW